MTPGIDTLQARLQFVARRNRSRMILAITLTVFGITVLGMREILFRHGSFISFVAIFVGVAAMGAGIGSLLFSYLQSGRTSDGGNSNEALRNEIDELRFEIMRLRKNSGSDAELKDLDKVIDTIVNNTVTNEYIAGKIDATYSKDVLEQTKLRQLHLDFENLRARMEGELMRLRKSANLNLVIGTLTTVIAVAALGFEVFEAHVKFTDTISLLSHYIPRFSLVIFIEIFAFFFLKMYKTNLVDIKYFNNEKTNIDFKIISLKTAIHQGNAELIKLSVEELIKTERNFKLNKDESTVELEKAKGEWASARQVTELLEKLGGRARE